MRGSDFDDTLLGTTGLFTRDEFRPRGGDDFIDGRAGGRDTLRYSGATQNVEIDLGPDNQTIQQTMVSDGFGGVDTFIGIEYLRSGSGDDRLFGDVNDNQLRGGAGNGSNSSVGAVTTSC